MRKTLRAQIRSLRKMTRLQSTGRRQHLSKFSGIEQIYQFMLSDASRRAKKINFNEQFPGSAEVVVNNVDIPGAFTKAGWTAMQENLAKGRQVFRRRALGSRRLRRRPTGQRQDAG